MFETNMKLNLHIARNALQRFNKLHFYKEVKISNNVCSPTVSIAYFFRFNRGPKTWAYVQGQLRLA